MASFIILFLSFTWCYAQERTPNDPTFSIQPPSEPLVFTYGSTAKFQCALQSTVMIVQRIDLVVIIDSMRYRGVNSIPEKFGVYSTFNGDIVHIFLPIRENGNTRVQCIAVFPTTSSGITPEVESQWGTIQIQGPLAAVSDLTTGDLIPGRSILLSWVAPFTLNVTNTEPDITYCVDIYVNVIQTTLHHIRSTCGITATTYNVTFNDGEVTPCDTVNITVIPVNGPPNNTTNGTERSLDHVYLFEGFQNFSANGVEISSREQDHGQVKFNIQLPDSVYMCNTTCSIRASSSSASYELNSGNYLTCHRNVITFTVSNNTGTALPRNDIYLINIEVGNSAGTGYSVGEISLSTHAIQQVTYASGKDSLQINATLTHNSSARGAQVILKPETLNESTCSQLATRNMAKINDFISNVIDSIPRGNYNIDIYTLNDKGIPESNAKSAINKGNRVHFSGSADSSQDSTAGNEYDLSVVNVTDTAATIRYRARPDGFIAVDLTSEGYSAYVIRGNTYTFQVAFSGNDSCLSLFPRHKDDGIIFSNAPASIFITLKKSDRYNENDIAFSVSVGVGVGISVIVCLAVVVIILLWRILRSKNRIKMVQVTPLSPNVEGKSDSNEKDAEGVTIDETDVDMKEQPYKDSEFGPSISVSQLSLRSMSQGQVTVRPEVSVEAKLMYGMSQLSSSRDDYTDKIKSVVAVEAKLMEAMDGSKKHMKTSSSVQPILSEENSLLEPLSQEEPDKNELDLIEARLKEIIIDRVKKHMNVPPLIYLQVMKKYNLKEHLKRVPKLIDTWNEFVSKLLDFAKCNYADEYSGILKKEWSNSDIEVKALLDMTLSLMKKLEVVRRTEKKFYTDKQLHSDERGELISYLKFLTTEQDRIETHVYFKGASYVSESAYDGILDIMALHTIYDVLPRNPLFAFLMCYVFRLQRKFQYEHPIFTKAYKFYTHIYIE